MKYDDFKEVERLVGIIEHCNRSRADLEVFWDKEYPNDDVFKVNICGTSNDTKYHSIFCLLTEKLMITLVQDLDDRVARCEAELARLGVDS